MMGRRPRVLMSAYACGPGVGSEPGIGWDFVLQAAHCSELSVITRANNRNAVEKAQRNQFLKNVRWLYYDLPSWSRFWKKDTRGVQLYYYLWQLGITRSQDGGLGSRLSILSTTSHLGSIGPRVSWH